MDTKYRIKTHDSNYYVNQNHSDLVFFCCISSWNAIHLSALLKYAIMSISQAHNRNQVLN